MNPLTKLRTVGLERAPFEDVYHSILVRPWWQFVLATALAFLGVNALFALLYMIEPGSVTNARPGNYEDAFYFSVQTLATIGYGNMAPATRFAHWVVTLEAFTGILTVAVITGVTFSKFSRPTARVAFSAKVAAPTRNGVPHLMFRMANRRNNLVVEATLRVLTLVRETTVEGETVRRPIELKLVRDRSALFTLSWTAMHAIEEGSPFYGEGALERLRASGAEMYLSFSGIDETFAQTIHARWRYTLDDIAWGQRFADILTIHADGSRVIDYSHFDEVVPVNQPANQPARLTERAGG
jgi:inward rectifier potassium channel